MNGETHTYRKLTRTYHKPQGVPRWPIEPERGAMLKRGGDSVVAGQACTEWSWTEDAATHTVCGTRDGVLLRLVVDGKTVIEANSVNYRQQPAEVFEVPADYAPTLEPGP